MGLAIAGGVVAVVLVTTRAGRQEGGPLGEPTTGGAICLNVPRGADATFGVIVLANSGAAPAVIETVALRQPRNVHLVAPAVFVPQTGKIAVGTDVQYPPNLARLPGVEWSQRRLAAGATVPTGGDITRDRNVFDLVVGVTRNGSADGSFSGTKIDYRVGSRKYVITTQIGVILYSGHCLDRGAPTTVPYPR